MPAEVVDKYIYPHRLHLVNAFYSSAPSPEISMSSPTSTFSHAIRSGIVIYAAFALHFYFKSERKQRENVQIVNAFTPVWLLLLLEWLAVCCECIVAYSHTVFYASS